MEEAKNKIQSSTSKRPYDRAVRLFNKKGQENTQGDKQGKKKGIEGTSPTTNNSRF